MKQFKFFQKENSRFSNHMNRPMLYFNGELDHPDQHIIGNIGQNRNNIIYEGWEANRSNLPPGHCPYDIGTQEREWWLTGWSRREDRSDTFNNLRWINVSVNNLRFEVYTHLSLGEIQHIITNISNYQENRELILRWLQSRFHRARMLDSIEFDGITIPITHENI